jgi:uncharacterized repeat protein (TIGR03806 family)
MLPFVSASLESRRTSAAPAQTTPPQRLSETGIFTDVGTLAPSAGVVPYDVNVPFWSDGAIKQRWIVLPGNGTNADPSRDRIIVKPGLPWAFPTGSVFVKQFSLPDASRPLGRRPLETRVLVRDKDGGVYGLSYKWNVAGTDAELLTTGGTEVVSTRRADGSTAEQMWEYPTPDYCALCHNQAAGGILGVNYRQIERRVRYSPDGPDLNQINEWNRAGLLSKSLDIPKALDPWNLAHLPRMLPLPMWNVRQEPPLTPIDSSASLETRARAYLDSNCSYCHAPGIVSADWDARWTTPLVQQQIVGARARIPRQGADLIVTPGVPEQSLLYLRLATNDPALRMPPLGRQIVDEEGARLLYAWIKSLPAGPTQAVEKP